MFRSMLIGVGIMIMAVSFATAAPQSDTIQTSRGDLKITFIGHGTLMFEFEGKVIQVDPWTKFGNYKELPKADLILITHEHQDHLDTQAIADAKKDGTVIIMNKNAVSKAGFGSVMDNGETKTFDYVLIEAVPAYNLLHKRDTGVHFHPKGEGNGYVLTFGDKRVYIAGDTENTPEMKSLKNIDVAFLPMNLPFTMTPEMVADAAKAMKPKILYPYHYGETKVDKLAELLKGENVDIRIRDMK